MSPTAPPPQTGRSTPRRILLLGATGTIGRATAQALVRRGHEVVCLVRARGGKSGTLAGSDSRAMLAGCTAAATGSIRGTGTRDAIRLAAPASGPPPITMARAPSCSTARRLACS